MRPEVETGAIMTIRPRRSVLYMPGSNARALEKARSLDADGLIFDLEDAVAPDRKQDARDCEPLALAAVPVAVEKNPLAKAEAPVAVPFILAKAPAPNAAALKFTVPA